MSQSSRPNSSPFSFLPTSTSSVSSSTGLGSSVNSVSPRLNSATSTSSNWRGHQQRGPTIFNRRINSCIEQTPDTNNGVSPSSILGSRLNKNTSYILTPNVASTTAGSSANAARVHPTTFPTLPRLNHNNISSTSNSSTSSASTNNMNLAALETQITEMMSHLNDLKLQFSSLNRPQQTQTPSIASSPNPTQLLTPTTTISTTTPTGTSSHSNTLFVNDVPSTSTSSSSATTTTPTTTLPLLSDVLQHFQCPFEHDPELLCGYYERHTEGGVCPFGHLLNAFNAGVELTDLPSSYLCLNHLLDECTNQPIKGQVSQLIRCPEGLHLTAAELVDGRRLQEMLATEVLTTDAQWQQRQQAMEEVVRNCLEMVCGFGAGTSGTTEDEETEEATETVEASAPLASTAIDSAAATPTEEPDCCSICHTEFTSVAAFGLLENCDHPFCADCILTWHQHQKDQPGSSNLVQTSSCPYCRVESARLVLWPEGRIESAEQKRAVFELQHRAVRFWSTSAPAAATTLRQTPPATPVFREAAAAAVVEPEPEEAGRGSVRDRIRRIQAFIGRNTPRN